MLFMAEMERLVHPGIHVESGGQPGSKTAWEDKAANALTSGYSRATRPVLEKAWLRPRYVGFIEYQNAATDVTARFLTGGLSSGETLDEFNRLLHSSHERQS
jgi:multiple sugar transport system substrate-binding protein